MQAPGEDAAGSPPSLARQDRKRSLQRHRGGVKHRKATAKAPPPSSAPCPFGCGCWFRDKCSFHHSAEDIAVWQEERAAKKALIDIAATRKKARLEGRSIRRSALSSLSNNTATATENTGAAAKEDKESCDGAASPVVSALVHHPDCSNPSSEQMERAKRTNRQDICCQVFSILGSATELPEPATVRACFLPAYFQKFATGPRSPPEHLKAHGTGWLQWKVTEKPQTAGRYLTLTQDGNHVKDCSSCSLSLEDLMLDLVHLSFPQHWPWPEELHSLVINSDV